MEYNYLDSEYYLLKAPYMSLIKSGVGAHLIEREVTNIRGYSKAISEFPGTKCEALEFIYLCHEALCALDEHLFEDFISLGWHGVIWASWLAAISPFPEKYMNEKLSIVIEDVPHNTWVVELALLSLSGTTTDSHFLLNSIYEIKSALASFPYTKLPLRKWPSDEYFALKQKESNEVLSVYKKHGADAALIAIKELPKTELDIPYKEWVLNHGKA